MNGVSPIPCFSLSLSLSSPPSFSYLKISLLHFRLSQAPPVLTHPGFRSVVKTKKMNRFAYQQTAFVGCVGVGDMRRGDISVCGGAVVCPKPRRIGLVDSSYVHSNESIRSEACDLKAGTELLDIILTKGNYDEEKTNFEMASSPPFYFGSPPSRVSNPLIQDSQFSNDNFVPILANPEAAAAPSPPPSFTSASAAARKNGGGCVPVKYGNKQAAVRIEGFNCRSSISAVA